MSALSVVNVLQAQSNHHHAHPNGNILVVRSKNPQILPATKEHAKGDALLGAASRKKAQRGGARVQNPPPVAVARRNARERNRVKQVNNGYATLRQHIPNSIAAAFESASGRGGNKKLSKVETLRMAVEYIRSLEDILSLGENDSQGNVSSTSTSSSYASPHSPTLNPQTNSSSYSYPTMSPCEDDDDLSTNPTPPPQAQQYVSRIPGTNTYQIITTHLYDDSENLEPLDVDEELLTDPSLMDADLAHDLSLLNSIHTTGSLSPEVYSDHSMSPCGTDSDSVILNHSQHHSQSLSQQGFLPIFAASGAGVAAGQGSIKLRLSPAEEAKLVSSLGPPVISLPGDSLLGMEQQHGMLDVMTWWEQQQQHQQQGLLHQQSEKS